MRLRHVEICADEQPSSAIGVNPLPVATTRIVAKKQKAAETLGLSLPRGHFAVTLSAQFQPIEIAPNGFLLRGKNLLMC